MKPNEGQDAAVPRRTARPKWLDPRIIGGLLLVIVAIVVGSKVVGSSAHTTAVWAASKDLAPGTVLTSGDLTPVEVNLAGSADHYLTADAGTSGVVGRGITSPVKAGELLAVSAIGASISGRIVVFGVSPEHMPAAVAHGSVIDLYLTTGGGASSSTIAETTLVSAGITVQTVIAPALGGLSGATSSRYQLSVLLNATVADALVRTLPKGEVIVVLRAGESG